MLVRMWGNRDSHSLMVKMIQSQEDSLLVSYKTKYALTIWSSDQAPSNLPKKSENVHLHKNLHTFIAALKKKKKQTPKLGSNQEDFH